MNRKQMLVAAGIDYDAAVSRFSGNSTLYETVLQSLPRDETFSKLGPALEAKDYEQAKRLTHTLKGVAGNLSVTPLYENAVQLMAALKAGNYDQAADLYDALQNAYHQAVTAITDTAKA